jgi:hypothetical protein
MAWPKKHTRRFHIENRDFLWHLNGNSIESDARITVGTLRGKYVLFIDPYAYDLEITPASILKAAEWALESGWSPDNGPSRSLAYSMEKKEFFWLPEGQKFAYEAEESDPDDSGDEGS